MEADFGILEETQSYKPHQMMVKTFNEVKLLSCPKEGGCFNAIVDTGDTTTYNETIFTPGLNNVKVAVVSNLKNKYHLCMHV